jgi:hypothetical protein
MKFNSQICTSREQSESLLALGLKKETADMVLVPSSRHDGSDVIRVRKSYLMEEDAIPAWSLHRLIEIVAQTQYPYYVISKELPIYDALCERIEWLIKEGYFNEGYLNKGGIV